MNGPLEVSLEREDLPARSTAITIKDKARQGLIVIQPHDAYWLIERLRDAIAATGAADRAA
jgi:hypothetical protein